MVVALLIKNNIEVFLVVWGVLLKVKLDEDTKLSIKCFQLKKRK